VQVGVITVSGEYPLMSRVERHVASSEVAAGRRLIL
jgi:hypothetical protein